MQTFNILLDFVSEMQASSSTLAKKKVLTKYKDNEFIKKILLYTYHPFNQYNVKPKTLTKQKNLVKEGYIDIFTLLDDLSSRKITGHEAISYVNGFTKWLNSESYIDLVHQILDRNLKTRATATIINEIIPNLIPQFSVQLCAVYEDILAKDEKNRAKAEAAKKAGKISKWKPILNYLEDLWLGSYKLDGYRAVGLVDENSDTRFYSRNGKEYHTFGKIIDEIKKLGFKNMVLDGELCINTDDNKDDFGAVQREAISKDHTIEKPMFWIFDMISTEDFNNMNGEEFFNVRLAKLHKLFEFVNAETMSILPQVPIESDEALRALRDKAISEGREGLILKKNTGYLGDRSDNMLKAKIFEDAEYRVIHVENDIMRVIIDGKEVDEMMLANVIIDHKGNTVSVGSGFSHAERRHYFLNPDEIIGKIITVKYQGESVAKNGKLSLRFPTLKAIHGDEREF